MGLRERRRRLGYITALESLKQHQTILETGLHLERSDTTNLGASSCERDIDDKEM